MLSPLTASAQEAASIAAVGWWSQRPGATALPEGGFEIALFPSGPVSQAALRIDVDTLPLASALLELTESEQVLGDVARVLACPTSDTWTPANPGPWADAPSANCDEASVALGRNDGTWTGDITAVLSGGTSSVVLLPFSELSEQQKSVTFQVVFSKARITASAASDPSGGAAPTSPPAYEPPPAIFSPSIPAGSVAVVPDPFATTSEPPASPTPEVEGPGVLATGGEEDRGDPKPWWRLLLGIPLSAVAGVGAVYVRRILEQQGLAGG